MADRIPNPSSTATMIATLRRSDGVVVTRHVRPHDALPVAGRIEWERWTLAWVEPRRGLVRFGDGPRG